MTLEQLTAVVRTQAQVVEDHAHAFHAPPREDRLDDPGDPRRVEASARQRLRVTCAPLAQAALALNDTLPAPAAGRVRAAAEALASRCALDGDEPAKAARLALDELQTALGGVSTACEGSTAAATPALRCAVARRVLEPMLAPLAGMDDATLALAEARQALRKAAAEVPYDPDRLIGPLSALGTAEGDHGVRCQQLVLLLDAHTARHRDLGLTAAHDALVAFSAACPAPIFGLSLPDLRLTAPGDRAAEAKRAYRAAAQAYAAAFTACAD